MPGLGEVARRRAGLGVRVDDRELDLVLVGAEVHEQLVDLVEDLGRAGVAAVDLVDRDDDRQPAGHRLLEDVARLRQRALGGVDEEQHRVDHQQRALDLAAEVGVAGRVDDVEPDAGVVDGRLLGEDRDPLLALEVARVEDPVDERLVRAEGARLAEHRVDERGLAVVDVGDDRDVAQVGAGRGGGGRWWRWARAGGSPGDGDSRLCHGTRDPGLTATPATLAAMTVAAVILSATTEGALADTLGQPRVRRLVDLAWSGGALPIVVVAPDPDGAVAAALAGTEAELRLPCPARGRTGRPDGPRRRARGGRGPRHDRGPALAGADDLGRAGDDHLADRGARPDPGDGVLRPGWQGEPGWPVLVPLEHLDALRAIAAGPSMPLDVIPSSSAAVPSRT